MTDRPFLEMARAHVNALAVLQGPMFFGERRRLVDLAARKPLPTVYPWKEFVDEGGLMAYGPNISARIC